MKKIALFLLVVLSTSLFPGSVGAKSADAPADVLMGVSQYHYEYLVKTAPQNPSFGADENATTFVSLSRCNSLVAINSVILTVTAEGFEITNSLGETAKNELSHTYINSPENDSTIPDTTTIYLKYTGDEATYGKITYKVTPSRTPGSMFEVWMLESTLFYAVNDDKIFFFNTEKEAQRKYDSLFFK